MLVFSTRLPLKDEITQENCMDLFVKWITQSPHYKIDSIDYDISSLADFDFSRENISFSFRHFKNDSLEISACRLENREEKAIWINDCIYLNENGNKSVLIQLNCTRTNFDTQLPYINKPHIVRSFVDAGYCKDDAGIPITDYPFDSDAENYELCVGVMNNTIPYSMPVVYVSCDYWNKTAINPNFIARKLSGVAHVFVEKDYKTALRLKEDVFGNNAHTGYVGIYFPGNEGCQKHSINFYNSQNEMAKVIIDAVRKALINRLDSSTYNWNQILMLQSRQKMTELQNISSQEKALLSEYMDTFDIENNHLREQIEELNREIYSLRSQLDGLRTVVSESSQNRGFYKSGSEPELYAFERTDLLYSVLSQAQNKFDSNSRAYVLIQSMLEANPPSGECKKVISGVQEIFGKTEKLTRTKISQLKSLGFCVEENGPHYKMFFHDPRYMFTVSKTPSDYREGKNLVSEICSTLDVEKKI